VRGILVERISLDSFWAVFDVIVRGRAYLDGDVVDVDILIEDGVITRISRSGLLSDDVIMDFSRHGLLILPGMIDIHVHLRDFDYSYKEDFYSGSAAAAAGGVCLVCDMPNTKPRVDNLSILYYRDKVASVNMLVDYGLYYGVPSSYDELSGFEDIAIGLKVYPDDLSRDWSLLEELFKYNSKNNVLTVFHPEDPSDLERGVRDVWTEVKAVDKIIGWSVRYGLRAHLTHITSLYSVERVLGSGIGISTDTCPHYLILSSDEHSTRYYRVYPPLRSGVVRNALLKGVVDGAIDILSTDHAPHTYMEKVGEDGWGGFPGLETALPILLDLFNRDLISLGRVVSLYSSNPARILGLDDRYGGISVGAYGSLTVVDLDRDYIVDPARFFSKAKHSPFEGMVFKGSVYATIVRGNLVYLDGEIKLGRGLGINVSRGVRRSVSQEPDIL
jgi:dihydroorotase